MTPVRGFFVDNLAGNLEGTLAVAKSPTGGVYPPGSVVQLFPNEVMVKRETGFNPVTHDWEFFELDVDKNGSTIRKRGFADIKNRFGGNCFACHIQARPEWDLICEQDHGCQKLPVSRSLITAMQKTDPRCKVHHATLGERFTNWLVRVLKQPFRNAHHVTGRLVAKAEARGVDLADLTLAEMQAEEPGITADIFGVLTVEASVASRTSYGGTAPANVAAQAARWLKALS